MSLPQSLSSRLRLPLIAAPMLRVSGPELVIAACRKGVIGAFPTANARNIEQLDQWIGRIETELERAGDAIDGRPGAPFCPNLIVNRPTMKDDLACLVRHRVEMVITSVGSPAPTIGPLHDIGCMVLADIASLKHAEKALAAGADGLILLTAGAGGQTGWANPLAFVRAVRAIFDGPIVLAGGIADGWALWAAEVLGCDLAYMGTGFIATRESMAPPAYQAMLVASTLDDVMTSKAFTGLDANMLRPSVVAAGLDPNHLPERVSIESADANFGGKSDTPGPRRWRDIWSAGHSVSGVAKVQSAADLIEQTLAEYQAAQRRTAGTLARPR